MRPILAGIETEYGLLVEGRGAEDQVDDSMALVRAYPGKCHFGWDYRYESPRSDLRGFKLEHLAQDPVDAKFDRGKKLGDAQQIRSDRVLPNGARFYNDHGHPEYSTPECWSIFELARHDCAGQIVVRRAASVFSQSEGFSVRCYKNNGDFHGASYGTHESYLVSRQAGFDRLYRDLLPMMIARQILVGAGKVGSETSKGVRFQLSQRADFLTENANAETLYRRPIFNTRDEPHADPRAWIRLHVICGDANMIPECTARKVGLMKLALSLSEEDEAPLWRIKEAPRAFRAVSQDETHRFRVELEGHSWTTAAEILESYFAAAESCLDLDEELRWVIDSSRTLLADLDSDFDRFSRHVDWAAKKKMLRQFVEEEGLDWPEIELRAYDLEYHNIDPNDGLHAALVDIGEVEPDPDMSDLLACLEGVNEPTRAYARSIAVTKFGNCLLGAGWRALTFDIDGQAIEVDLPPNSVYPLQLGEAEDVGTFISMLRGVQ